MLEAKATENATENMIKAMMGIQQQSKFFRPIQKAINTTKEIEKAKDNRAEAQGSNGTKADPIEMIIRIADKLSITRDIYGERSRADNFLREKA